MTVQNSRCPIMKTHEAKHPYRYGTSLAAPGAVPDSQTIASRSTVVACCTTYKVWESGCGAMFTPDENEVPNHNERTDLVGSVG